MEVIQEARANQDDNIRFMPIIMLTSNQNERIIRKFLMLGCDDIILYPCTSQPLANRLRMQIDQQFDYFQTAKYFGPDRRKKEHDADHPDRRGGKDSYYRHIEIRRDLRGGVKVLSSQVFEPETRAAG